MKTKKTIFILLLTALMILIVPSNALAAENTNDTNLEKYADMYGITTEEVTNLNENLDEAIKNVPTVNNGQTITVPVSENIYAEVSLSEIRTTSQKNCNISYLNSLISASSTYYHTITSSIELKNVFGNTIVTLNAVGVFTTNGTSSTPTDAYGTYDAILWNVTTTEPKLGSSCFNAYVRISFSGQFDLGIDPISITIQEFSHACTIYCNAAGSYSASWN